MLANSKNQPQRVRPQVKRHQSPLRQDPLLLQPLLTPLLYQSQLPLPLQKQRLIGVIHWWKKLTLKRYHLQDKLEENCQE